MPVEFLIIDAYNVMVAAGFVVGGKSNAPGQLERSRKLFLGILSRGIPNELRQRTTVVFDAKSAPSGLPNREIIQEIEVLFATEYPEADDQIEYLIKRHSAPKQLTVVSSDHRLQTAAKRRNAKFVDSDIWFDQLRETLDRQSDSKRSRPSEKDELAGLRDRKLNSEETSRWLDEFAIDDPSSVIDEAEQKATKAKRKLQESTEISEDVETTDYGPFPPGYGEDLLDEFEQ